MSLHEKGLIKYAGSDLTLRKLISTAISERMTTKEIQNLASKYNRELPAKFYKELKEYQDCTEDFASSAQVIQDIRDRSEPQTKNDPQPESDGTFHLYFRARTGELICVHATGPDFESAKKNARLFMDQTYGKAGTYLGLKDNIIPDKLLLFMHYKG